MLFLDLSRKLFGFVVCLQTEEEINTLQKKVQATEADLDAAQEQLGEANTKLEAKEKAATDVSHQQVIPFDTLARTQLLSKHEHIPLRITRRNESYDDD